MRHHLIGAGVAISLVVSSVVPATALAPCLPGLCPFSESGKKGRFLDTRIDANKLAANDATLKTATGSSGLLAAQSVNRGELFGAGLQMRNTERKLEGLIDLFRPYWKYRDIPPIHVRIVGTTSFVPIAFADNTIVVPLGILMDAKSDDQVAWLLAHEFSHIALAHFASEARAKKRKKAIGQVVGAVDTLVVASQTRVDTSNGGKLRLYEVTDKDAVALGNSVWGHSRQLEDALLLAGAFFTRRDEDRADVMGVDLVQAAGFARSEAMGALAVIRDREEANASLFDIVAAQTGEYAKKSGLAALGSAKKSTNLGDLGTNWLKDLGDNAIAVAFKETKKAYLVQHRPTEKRITGITTYSKRAYDGVPENARSLKLLKDIRATSEFIDASRAITARAAALDAIATKDAAQAMIALRPALSTQYAGTPLIANVQAQIAEVQGDLHGADAAYTRAERLQNVPIAPLRATPTRSGKKTKKVPAPPVVATRPAVLDPYLEQNLLGFQSHVTLLVRMAQYAKALAVIGEAKKRFGDDEGFLPQYIAIYTATKNTDMLVATLNRCTEVADPAVEQGCRTEMLTDAQRKKMDQLSPADQAKVDTALARSSSKAKGGGLISQIRDAVKPRDDDEGDDGDNDG